MGDPEPALAVGQGLEAVDLFQANLLDRLGHVQTANGRDCSRANRPSAQPHSMSTGWPKCRSMRRASSHSSLKLIVVQARLAAGRACGHAPNAATWLALWPTNFSILFGIVAMDDKTVRIDVAGHDRFAQTIRGLDHQPIAVRGWSDPA